MFRWPFLSIRFNFLQILLIACCFVLALCLIFNKAFSSENIEGWMTNRGHFASDYVLSDKYTALTTVKSECTSSKVPVVLVIVCSAVGNHQLRSTIRETWASDSKKHDINVLFLVGQSLDQRENENVVHENLMYGDVIVEDFVDSYYNLTLKSIMLLKWVNQNCKNVPFIMKMDDDVYMNVENLLKFINKEYKVPKNVLVGKLYANQRPDRRMDSKWYVPEDIYPGNAYPDFLCGVGFLMSQDVASKLYEETFKQELYFLEDVFITGMCAEKINVDRKEYIGFLFFEHPIDVECNSVHLRLILLSHYITPKSMSKIHAQLQKCKNLV